MLRAAGLLDTNVKTVSGETLDACLDWWEQSERRRALRRRLKELDGIDAGRSDHDAGSARSRGLTSTVCFPVGNLAPEGSVIKSTAIDPSLIGEDNVYRHRGPARVFITEEAAIRAIKSGEMATGRCDGADLRRAEGRGDAGDLSDHVGAEGSCRTASMWRC